MVAILIQVVFALVVAGVLLLIAQKVLAMIPMLAPFKDIVMLLFVLIAIIVLVTILMPLFGGLTGGAPSIGHYRN